MNAFERFARFGAPPLYLLSDREDTEVTRDFKELGLTATTIRGERVADEESLLAELAIAFGFPDGWGRNWDAFIDCIGDFAEAHTAATAVRWQHADNLLHSDPRAFIVGTHQLLAAANDLRFLNGTTFQLIFFLSGSW